MPLRTAPLRSALHRSALPGGDGTICLPPFYPSTHYLLRFGALTSGHSSLCSRHATHRGISISCGHQEPGEHAWRGVCTRSYTHPDPLSHCILTWMRVFIQTQEPLVRYSDTLHVMRESAFRLCPSTTINTI